MCVCVCVAIVYAVSWGNKKFSLDVHYAGFSSLIYIVYVVIVVCFIHCACYFKFYIFIILYCV